jgi:hypothetical protein
MTTECPECGSERRIEIGCLSPTGVSSPDGGQEYRYQGGLQCLDCGAIEPDEE